MLNKKTIKNCKKLIVIYTKWSRHNRTMLLQATN